MTTPKHRAAPGSSYFATTKCWEGRVVFQIPEAAEILVQTLLHYRDRGDYLLHEFVVMPDHLHLLLTPGAKTSLEKTIQLIKGGSSHRIHAAREGRTQIWQVGFHDWTIRDESDWRAKAQYIWMNPVRAGLAARPEDWKCSSAAGGFVLDAMPEKYLRMASGAKAPVGYGMITRGLKPPPPKETASVGALRRSRTEEELKVPPPKEKLKAQPAKENAMRWCE